MRKLLIDTDTASDDAVAIVMALRERTVSVEGITVVVGNCEIEQCVQNALVSIEKAGTYAPPVFSGMTKPLFKTHFTSHHIHGKDGMGNMENPPTTLKSESLHAVDAILLYAEKFKGELEIVTLGPLTNLAMAVLKEPTLAKKIKHVYIMGGAGLTSGNITPLAEFNFFVDAEAANIVMQSGLPMTVVGWEIGMGEAFINEDDIAYLNQLSPLGQFAVRCNKSLMEFNAGRTVRKGFDLPDPTTMAVALFPDIVEEAFSRYSWVEYKCESSYGHYVIDATNLTGKAPNARIILKIKSGMFKEKLFSLLADSAMMYRGTLDAF